MYSLTDILTPFRIVPDKTSYSSDYFQEMYELAIALIKDGKAFADDSELGKGDESRRNRLRMNSYPWSVLSSDKLQHPSVAISALRKHWHVLPT